MLLGIDTSFLVQAALIEHPGHQRAMDCISEMACRNGKYALAPLVMSEFLHVITDERRFESPVQMPQALELADRWWHAPEVTNLFPSEKSSRQYFSWLESLKLGRKRLLDTELAAIYHANSVQNLVTSNARDFEVFGCFEIWKI